MIFGTDTHYIGGVNRKMKYNCVMVKPPAPPLDEAVSGACKEKQLERDSSYSKQNLEATRVTFQTFCLRATFTRSAQSRILVKQ